MKRSLQYGLASAISLALVGQAQAAGTLAGQTVSNTATINYTVSGVAQPSVPSNTSTFRVDRRVNLTVAELGGGAETGAPGASSRVSRFTVTNTTNDVMDYRLAVTQDANGATTAFNDTDTFDVTTVTIRVDNGDGIYNATDDAATYIDELAADGIKTVFVIYNIPTGRVDSDTAGFTLTATAAVAGTANTEGAVMVETTGADTQNAVDTVFGDGAGDTDVARDGKFSDDDEFDVASAVVQLLKSSKVISDPFSTSNFKAIPGAVMEYCIQVQNTGSTPADLISVSDPIPTNTTYAPNSIFAGGTVTGGVCNADGVAEDDNSTDSDENDPRGGNFDGTAKVVSVTFPSVAAGATVTTRFRVSVN